MSGGFGGGSELGGLGGSSKHLNDLLERGGVSLNEGGGIRISRLGSGERSRLLRCCRRCRRWRMMVVFGGSVAAVTAAARATIGAMTCGRWKQSLVLVMGFLVSRRSLH